MTNRETQIQKCRETYGISKTEAEHIYTASNSELSIDELRIKYNFPQLGKEMPDWLEEEELARMAFSVAKLMYKPKLYMEINYFELVNMLYIQASIKLYTIRSHAQLKHAMVMMSVNIYRDLMRKLTYISKQHIEDMDSYDSYSADKNDYEFAGKYLKSTDDDAEFIKLIKNIKSPQIRMILIISGYILADMDDLYEDFCALFETEDKKLLKKLNDILDIINDNERIHMENIVTKDGTASKKRRKNLTFNSILKALGLYRQKDLILNKIANELY